MALEIFFADTTAYPKGWSWLSHQHSSCYQMYYIEEGKGKCEFVIGGDIYFVKEGDIMLCRPKTNHELINADEQVDVVYEFQFDFLNPLLADALARISPVMSASSTAKSLLPVIAKFGPSRNKDIKNMAVAALETVLMDMVKDDLDLSLSTLNAAFIDVTGYKRITTGVITYIDHNYQKPILLDDIAKALGCNKSYMCTLFKNDCGITINDYLNSVRIHKAAEYLSYTDKEISYICTLVGFRNISHFNRTFKQYLSVPPSWFKRFSPININTDRMDVNPSVLGGKIKEVEDRVGGFRNGIWPKE